MASRGSSVAWLSVGLVILVAGGCANSTIGQRKAERATAYAALPENLRSLVDQGKLAVGMDTNAVFIAWGRPSEAKTYQDLPQGPELRWRYFRQYKEDRPANVYTQSGSQNQGINVYTIHYTTSWQRLWREVAFRDGRAYWWQTYDRPPTEPAPPSAWDDLPVLSPR